MTDDIDFLELACVSSPFCPACGCHAWVAVHAGNKFRVECEGGEVNCLELLELFDSQEQAEGAFTSASKRNRDHQ